MKKFKYTNNELREILLDFPLRVNESGKVQVETIPVSGTCWIEGKEYVDGRDFERHKQCVFAGDKWFDVEDDVYRAANTINQELTRQAAVLINPNNSTAEITEEKCEHNSIIDTGLDPNGLCYCHECKQYFKGGFVSEPIKEREQEESANVKDLAYCAFIAGIANPQLKSGELNSFFEEWYSRNYKHES